MTSILTSLRKRLNSFSPNEQPPTSPKLPPTPTSPSPSPPPTPSNTHTLVISSLPVEICLALLQSTRDIYTLRSLVYSSPHFLPIYSRHRQAILNSVFGRRVDMGLMQEARFARATSRIDFRGADVPSQIEWYVKRYHVLRKEVEPGGLNPMVVDYEQGLRMGTLYSAIYVLAGDFCKEVSRGLGVKGTEDEIRFEGLNEAEQHRIKRAFFRYEIFCNLYRDRGIALGDVEDGVGNVSFAPGLGRYNLDVGLGDDFDEALIDDATKARVFLAPFTSQEVWEFQAVHVYCTRRWQRIVSDLGVTDIGFDGYIIHLCMLGLEFMRIFLHDDDNDDEKKNGRVGDDGNTTNNNNDDNDDDYDGEWSRDLISTARRRTAEQEIRLIKRNEHYEICDPDGVVKEYDAMRRDRDTDFNRTVLWQDGFSHEQLATGGVFWDRERKERLRRALDRRRRRARKQGEGPGQGAAAQGDGDEHEEGEPTGQGTGDQS